MSKWKNMSLLTILTLLLPCVSSHADTGAILNRGNSLAALKSRNIFDTVRSPHNLARRWSPSEVQPNIIERQSGAVPTGASTSSIARPHVGSVPYGTRINSCTSSNVIALTFDDGPYSYTKDILDLLDQYNAKATFFITGNNFHDISDCASEYPALIQRMHNSGHQIASHTWTHPYLNTLSLADFNNQMYYNEMALRNIVGFIPTYMRPPYVDCDVDCFSRLNDLGYHVIYYDLDTFDYANDDPSLIQTSKDYFSNYFAPHPTNGLVLSHDIHYQTVYNLTKFMLDTMAADGYGTSVTVGTCLGDAPENWYRTAGTPTDCGTPSPLTISTDGTCSNGVTCQGSSYGNCCSQYDHCGSTTDFCGVGCQDTFGTCGVSTGSPTSSLPGTTTTTSATPTASLRVSTDGHCGSGVTCLNSSYGDCCSRYGFCGSTPDHCGPYCQSSFGSCTPANPSTTPRVSTDGSCGSGITCQGSTFGNCCSRYNFCGSTTAFCGTGCNPSYGACT